MLVGVFKPCSVFGSLCSSAVGEGRYPQICVNFLKQRKNSLEICFELSENSKFIKF